MFINVKIKKNEMSWKNLHNIWFEIPSEMSKQIMHYGAVVKNPLPVQEMQEIQVQFLGQEDLPE